MTDAPLTVTALRESPRTPGRFTIQLSNGQRFTLGIGALHTLGLTRTGIALDEPALARLTRESTIGTLVNRAVDMLARARRTQRELERRLQRLEPDRELVRDAMTRLEQLGVLDDAAVAQAEAASQLRRGTGPARVQQRLRQKGVDDRTTRQAISAAVDDSDFDERATCRQVAERRLRSLQKLDPPVARRRLIAFLLRRGYAGSIVRETVANLIDREH